MKVQTCPVCGGIGTVPQGFYDGISNPDSTNTGRDTCRSCDGCGVLYISED